MERWEDIRRWRKEQRSRLIAARSALPLRERERLSKAIADRLGEYSPLDAPGLCVGFYWPIRGEPDLRPFVRGLLERGCRAALPVVVEKNAPIELWRWDSATKLTRQSVWGIPVPAERHVVRPDVLLIPLVGFDAACYRLGYGGGYYDRTLAGLDPQPTAIGVGFELGRLPTIHPQPHDVPMRTIVTEKGIAER